MSSVVRAAPIAATANAVVSAAAHHTARHSRRRAPARPSLSSVIPGVLVMRCSQAMRIALVVTGGVDASARDRVVPALLWLIERLARRHDLHVFALHYHRKPMSYPLLGATVHDLGRVDGPPGFRRPRVTARLRRAVA